MSRQVSGMGAFFLSLVLHALAAILVFLYENTQPTPSGMLSQVPPSSTHLIELPPQNAIPAFRRPPPVPMRARKILSKIPPIASPRPSAPEAPFKNTEMGLVNSFYSDLENQIAHALEYPPAIQRQKIQGRVEVQFYLEPEGSVSGLAIRQSSGYSELDELARRAVERAVPFRIRTELSGPLKIRLPIQFKLQPD